MHIYTQTYKFVCVCIYLLGLTKVDLRMSTKSLGSCHKSKSLLIFPIFFNSVEREICIHPQENHCVWHSTTNERSLQDWIHELILLQIPLRRHSQNPTKETCLQFGLLSL